MPQVTIYPNPADDHITISGIRDVISISIYNVNGQKVFAADRLNSSIDISQFEQGLYLVSILTADGNEISSRFIKK